MKKVKFTYKKEDNSITERVLLEPKYLKESANYLKEFEKESVKYIQGYEFDKTGLSEKEINEYEETISDFYELGNPTLEDYLIKIGLDSKRIKTKVFKKDNVSNFQII